MRRWFLLSLLLINVAYASPIQTWYLSLAQYYSHRGHYAQARLAYEKITPKDDNIHYNLGNLLYREKAYQEAISHYTQIDSPALMHQKYHNIANCLMRLGETALAVTFYQNALKFSSHPDTRFNLSLARSLLAQKAKEEKEKERRDANEVFPFRDGTNRIERYKEDNGTANLKDAKDPSTILKKRNTSNTVQVRKKSIIDTTQDKDLNASIQKQDSRTVDRYEAQRWENYFQNRTLKTLLIPLNTPGVSHDQDPY